MVIAAAGHGFLRVRKALLAVRHRLAVVVEDLGLLAEEGAGAGAGLERDHRRRRDLEHPGLGLPPGVHDRAAPLADDAVVPLPRLGV